MAKEGSSATEQEPEEQPAEDPEEGTAMKDGAATTEAAEQRALRSDAGEDAVMGGGVPRGRRCEEGLPAIEEEDARSQRLVVAIDMENAYGRASRAAMVEGVTHKMPALAPLAAAEWRPEGTRVWQRVLGAWRGTTTYRGGWQGSRLTQNGFCAAMVSSLERCPPVGAARIGYQDD